MHKEKDLPNDSERLLTYWNFTDKKQNGYCLEAVYFAFSSIFLIFTYHHEKSEFLQIALNVAYV